MKMRCYKAVYKKFFYNFFKYEDLEVNFPVGLYSNTSRKILFESIFDLFLYFLNFIIHLLTRRISNFNMI